MTVRSTVDDSIFNYCLKTTYLVSGRGVPEMALLKKQYHSSTQTMLKTGSLVILLATTSLSVSSAQTVVIGGSNSRPVTVNMPSAYGAQQGYVLQRRQSPFARSTVAAAPVQTAPSTDFSKSAEIRYGDEVIKLVPPGSQPKRKKKPVTAKATPKVKPASEPKPETAVAKAAPQKTAPVTKVDKVAEPAPAPAAPKSEPKVAAAEPAPAAPMPKAEQPEVKTAPEVKAEPKVTAKTEPEVVAKAAPEAPKEQDVAPQPVDIKPKVEEAPKAAEPEKEMQVASVEPKQTTEPVAAPTKKAEAKQAFDDEDVKQILFEDGATELPSTANAKLEALAKSLADSNDRIQLVAYANASSNGTARRLSLGRALVIRSKLMDLGVPNNKIEVRALGKPTDSSPADRVDLKLVAR